MGHPCKNLPKPLLAPLLPSGGFGGRKGKEGVRKKPVEKLGVGTTPTGKAAVPVEGESPSRHEGGGQVHQHVAGTGIEGDDGKVCSGGRKAGNVGNPSDVKEGPGALSGKEGPVEDRSQRGSMTFQRHISSPKLRDHRSPEGLCQGKGLGRLVGDPPACGQGGEKVQPVGSGMMANGDSMGADDIEVGGGESGVPEKLAGHGLFHRGKDVGNVGEVAGGGSGGLHALHPAFEILPEGLRKG